MGCELSLNLYDIIVEIKSETVGGWELSLKGMDKICVARRLVTQYCSAIAYSTGAGSFSRMTQWFPSTFCTKQKCNYFWFVQNIDRKRVTKIIKNTWNTRLK